MEVWKIIFLSKVICRFHVTLPGVYRKTTSFPPEFDPKPPLVPHQTRFLRGLWGEHTARRWQGQGLGRNRGGEKTLYWLARKVGNEGPSTFTAVYWGWNVPHSLLFGPARKTTPGKLNFNTNIKHHYTNISEAGKIWVVDVSPIGKREYTP